MKEIRPAAEWELAGIIADADANGRVVEVVGNGGLRTIGRPFAADVVVSMSALRGASYSAVESGLVSALAGTQIKDLELDLGHRGQRLGFEPLDLGMLLGGEPIQGTIGSVFAVNLAGSRRIAAGSARDAIIGVKAVTGAGQPVAAGAWVARNAVGRDLMAALVGSWGTLAVMTEIAFRVEPLPEEAATLMVTGLPTDIALDALREATLSPLQPTGAVHLEAELAGRMMRADWPGAGEPVTAIRLEGHSALMPARIQRMQGLLATFGTVEVLDDTSTTSFWTAIRQLRMFVASDRPVWRLAVRPGVAGDVLRGIRRYFACEAMLDWGGSLIWLEVPHSADAGGGDIRRVLAALGGHATLMRAPDEVRAAIDIFQPLEIAVDRLSRDLKSVFDPRGTLNPGRMYAGA